MQSGQLFGDVLEVEHVWLGVPGASPSMRLLGGRPVAWNPLSGVDRKVDQIWRQADAPSPGVHYAWLGEPHVSESVKRVDGVEVERNLVPNPSYEVSTVGVSTAGPVSLALSTWGPVVLYGGRSMHVTLNADATSTTHVTQVARVTPGKYLGVKVPVRWSQGSRYARLYFTFRREDGTHISYVYPVAPTRLQNDYSEPLETVLLVPATAHDVLIRLQILDTDSTSVHPVAGTSIQTDGWHATVADTEADALAQISTYFDGDTASDRAHDLWYNAEGAPHEWVNGEGWAEADERLAPVPDNFMHLPIDTSFTGDTPNVYRTQDDTVRTYTSRIIVDGVPRPHVSWDIDREIPGGVTPQVVSGSGIMQATGTIVWADEQAVKASGDNPWNPTSWWPDEGQQVEIYVSDGVTEWKQFTGVIDETIGDVGDPVIQSRIIDRFDDLSVKVSHEAILRKMPPAEQGGAYRYCDLVPSYYLDYAFRAAGWNCTPRQEPRSSVFAPLNGGAWAHNGTLVSATDFSTSSTTPTNQRTPWGFGVGNARLMYEPEWSMTAADPVQITLMIAPGHDDQASVQVEYTTGRIVRLVVGTDRSVTARTGTDASNAAACSLSASQMDGATVVTLLVKGSAVSLRNDQGHAASGTGTAPSGDLRRVGLTAWPDASVGGLMVNHPDQTYMDHRPSVQWGNPVGEYRKRAYIDTSNISHLSVITAAPAIVSRTADSVIEEISEALLGAAWIDEHGNMRWSSGQAMRLQSVVDTVTTADHVTRLSVNKSLLGSRSLVTVKFSAPAISESRYQMIEVWRGNTKTLTSGDHAEDIITPPADEEWVEVDTGYTRVGPYNAPAYNAKRGSFMGLTYTQDGDYYPPGGIADVTTFERIGPAAWKLTHTVPSLPSDVQAQTRTPDIDENGVEYYSWNRNNSLPLVQAGAKVQWQDEEAIPTGVFGVGPELVHDVGPWAASNIAENIGSYIQSATQRPLPVIAGMDVIADPRRQLGDVIHIDSPALMGVRVRAMIKSIRNSFGPDGLTQALSLITISSTTLWQTYEQFNAAGGALTHRQWNALAPTPTDYEAFNTAASGDR